MAPLLRLQSLFAIFVLLTLYAMPLLAATRVNIGVVTDGPMTDLARARRLFFGEITALTEGEFDVRFPESKQLDGGWDIDKIRAALDRLQKDPRVDMVLGLGFVSSQIAATSVRLRKPTFAPLVLDPLLLGLPRKGNTSGVRNLNYLAEEVRFNEDFDAFRSVVDFDKVAVVVDETIYSSVPDLAQRAKDFAADYGVELEFVLNDKSDDDIVAKIPAHIEAVMVAALPRLSEEGRDRLIRGLIDRKLPSLSFIGSRPVERGMLMSIAPDSDWQRLARQNALNMQAVLLGERAGNQPVSFEAKRQLTINMATARAIGVFPPFDVMSDAVMLNEDESGDGVEWSLPDVALEAVRANLDIQASLDGVRAGAEQVQETRSALFPQLNASAGVIQLDDSSSNVRRGFSAERTTTGAIGLDQIIYSEATRAGVDVQEYSQSALEANHRAVELDIVQEATVAFLNVLKAQTLVNINRRDLELTRTNLELARDRVRVGSVNASDVFRWESQIATSRQNLLGARAQLEQAMDNLNRVLHRRISERFRTVPAALDDPTLLVSREDLLDLIDNQYAFRLMGKWFLEQGLRNSPELLELESLIAASERQLLSSRRAYWSPDVSLSGQISRVLDEQRLAGESLEDDNDWQLGINATLPLYQGGARKARVNRAQYELNQLRKQHALTRDRVEQGIRGNLHAVRASFPSIELAQEAATASRKNFDLVQDSYSQGTVSIIDLLDAQDAALDAEQRATDAVYDFLIDLMNLQRTVAEFDFFLDDERRDAAVEAIKSYIAEQGESDG